MQILHVASIDFRRFQAGPTYSVPALADHQRRLTGVQTCILNTREFGSIPSWLSTPVIHFQGINGSVITGMPESFQRPSIVSFHSTYIPAYADVAAHFRRLGIPYVITPRGGMTAQAQSLSGVKKWAGNLFFFNRLIRGAQALHCLTEGEAREIVRWHTPRFVVGNGVELPPEASIAQPGIRSEIVFAFIGRTDVFHKGADLLVEGVSRVAELLRASNAGVHIYGPDHERGGHRFILQQSEALQIRDLIEVRGPVWGDEKARVLCSADVFVLLSRFEGHPMGLLEALASGLPAIVTPGTNMGEEIEEAKAGWCVEPTVESVAEGFRRILASRSEWGAMGQRARALVEERYTWPKLAAATVEHYRRIISDYHSR